MYLLLKTDFLAIASTAAHPEDKAASQASRSLRNLWNPFCTTAGSVDIKAASKAGYMQEYQLMDAARCRMT